MLPALLLLCSPEALWRPLLKSQPELLTPCSTGFCNTVTSKARLDSVACGAMHLDLPYVQSRMVRALCLLPIALNCIVAVTALSPNHRLTKITNLNQLLFVASVLGTTREPWAMTWPLLRYAVIK